MEIRGPLCICTMTCCWGTFWVCSPAGGFQNQEWYAFIFRISRGESDSEIDTPFVNPQRTSHHVTCGGILAWCLNCLHFPDFEIGPFTLRHLPTVVRTPLLQSRSWYKCRYRSYVCVFVCTSTCGLVATTPASHAEGR